MKKLLLLFSFIAITKIYAQSIPNPGFETWSQQGPFNVPSGWAVSPAVNQSNQAHSGSYALQCKVDTFVNPQTSSTDTIAPTAYTGTQTMGPPPQGVMFGGFAYNIKADSLTGWYMFNSVNGDSFKIMAYLSHWNTTTSSREIIAQTMMGSNVSVSTYTRFSLPFNYLINATPDTAFIQVQAADMRGAKNLGTSIWVDDLAFVTQIPAGVSQASINHNDLIIYPNPANELLYINTKDNSLFKNITIYNNLGQLVMNTSSKTVNIADWAKGVYTVLVYTNTGEVVSQKVIKN